MIVSKSDSSGNSEQDELVDMLIQTSFAAMAVLNRVAAEHDLSLTQLRVFAILRDRRLRLTDLAEYLGLERSTMTGLVDRANKRGLLERAANSRDGRAVDVFLSPAGVELVEHVYPLVAGSISRMTDGLTPAERRRLHTLLARIL